MGKSSLAQLVLEEHRIPYVSTDALTAMLKPVGQPSFYSPKKSDTFFPYFELFIERMTKSTPDYLIEGDAFSPVHIKRLQEKYDIKSVFLTMQAVNAQSVVDNAKFDRWTDNIDNEKLANLCERIEKASKDITAQCAETELVCFDLSHDYQSQFMRAFDYLVS